MLDGRQGKDDTDTESSQSRSACGIEPYVPMVLYRVSTLYDLSFLGSPLARSLTNWNPQQLSVECLTACCILRIALLAR